MRPSVTDQKAAGEVLTAKQAPHRPGIAPALGLRAELPLIGRGIRAGVFVADFNHDGGDDI